MLLELLDGDDDVVCKLSGCGRERIASGLGVDEKPDAKFPTKASAVRKGDGRMSSKTVGPQIMSRQQRRGQRDADAFGCRLCACCQSQVDCPQSLSVLPPTIQGLLSGHVALWPRMVVGVCDGLIGYEPIASRTDQTWDSSRSDRLEIPPSRVWRVGFAKTKRIFSSERTTRTRKRD